jgi:hypothetical protein
MHVLEIFLIACSGVVAGFLNAVVGAGTLVTFPTLLALGYPPVTANVSNCVGLISGSASGTWGYRDTLRGLRGPGLVRLCLATGSGAVVGSALVLSLPVEVFAVAVPVLIALGCVLMFVPSRAGAATKSTQHFAPSRFMHRALFCCGMYGGYFGAAQGVILLGVLRQLQTDHPTELNATKNLLGFVANATAGAIFAAVAAVAWNAALSIALGSLVGGWLGARLGRNLSANALRVAVVIVGAAAITSHLR